MKALVHIESGIVNEIVADNATFDVHSDFAWKEFDETALSYKADAETGSSFTYDKETDAISRKTVETQSYEVLRRWAYNPIEEQLDQLWHDIDDGKLGEAAKTGVWYNGVKSTKSAHPKG